MFTYTFTHAVNTDLGTKPPNTHIKVAEKTD